MSKNSEIANWFDVDVHESIFKCSFIFCLNYFNLILLQSIHQTKHLCQHLYGNLFALIFSSGAKNVSAIILKSYARTDGAVWY